MHPYYQRFSLNESRIFLLYEALIEIDLLITAHTGFDIAFPRDRIADPERICFITEKYPKHCFIAPHPGAWEDWDEVEKHIIGKEIYLEISYTLGILDDDTFIRMITKYPADYLLFGTDSPRDDQKRMVEHFLSLPLPDSLKEKMLFSNAARLLRIH